MTSAWLILLFGLTLLGAACNTPTWWGLALARTPLKWRHRMVRWGLALFNAGMLVGCWLRLSEAAMHPAMRLNPIPLVVGLTADLEPIFVQAPPQFAPGYLLLFVIAELLMLIASADALKDVGKRSIGLRLYLILAVLWIGGNTFWGAL